MNVRSHSDDGADYNICMASPLHLWPFAPELALRNFGFSPAIKGITNNEWTLRGVSADEAVVRNALTQEELSVPRKFIGDVSRLEEAVRVVTLLRKLECVDGVVRPLNRAVITMPVSDDAPRLRADRPAAVVAIRELPDPTPRWKHYLRVLVALGCLAGVVAVYVFREGRSGRVRRYSGRPSRLVPHPPASVPPVPLERR